MERRFEKGEFDPWEPGNDPEHLSVKDAVEEFMEAKSNRRPRTRQTYRQQLEAWMESYLSPGLTLRDVAAADLKPYVWQGDTTNATKRKRYRHLRTFLNHMVKAGHLDSSPLAGVEKPKKEKKQAAFLSTENVETLLRSVDAHHEITEDIAGRKPDDRWLKHMIRVGICTGLRRGELCRLRWRDVDLGQRLLTVRSRSGGGKTKSGNERQLPLRGDALDVLRRLHEERRPDGGEHVFRDGEGRNIKPNRASKRFKFFVRKAKLPERERLRLHSLRHTAGSWLAMRGVPMRVIQAILGHSTVQVTERYSHLQPEVMGKAMEEAFGGRSFGN
jgi:integrase